MKKEMPNVHSHFPHISASHISAVIITAILITISGAANSHFEFMTAARIIHISRTDQLPNTDIAVPSGQVLPTGLRILMRIPAPFIYAQALSTITSPEDRVVAPFLQESLVDGTRLYGLDRMAIGKDPSSFATFVANGYRVMQAAKELKMIPVRTSIHDNRNLTNFSDIERALDSFSYSDDYLTALPNVGDSVIDIDIWLPDAVATSTLSIQSVLPQIAVPADFYLENFGFDHRFGTVRPLSAKGQLSSPMSFDGSLGSSLLHYIWQGMEHIFIGIDHVLFVICLALAAGLSRRILWSITGFTLGHSITLASGTFGFVPHGAWFPPAIELTIALSIIVAAGLVLFNLWRTRSQINSSPWSLFALTGLIGLLHGYGFSFVFGDLLGGSVQQVTIALVGFNIGVEIGQLLIVAAVLVIVMAVSFISTRLSKWLSSAIAAGSIGIASIWVVERGILLQSELAPWFG